MALDDAIIVFIVVGTLTWIGRRVIKKHFGESQKDTHSIVENVVETGIQYE